MNNYTKEIFEEFYDEDSREVFEDILFERCQFNYCNLSQTENPFNRTTLRNIIMKNCTSRGGSLGCAILDEITVENFANTGLLQTWGAVFKHVTLKGRLGRVMLTNSFKNSDSNVELAFQEENKEFYSNIDWALDISEGEFVEIDMRGIPSELIRLDLGTQAIIKRDNIPEDWRKIKFNSRVTPTILGAILQLNLLDYVYVAPKRAKDFDIRLKDLKILRETGIAQ